MRATWQGLTLRGRAVLASGVAIGVLAALLGQRDLFRVAVLLVALPLVAVVVLARRDDRVTIVRSLEPAQVQAGGTATVRLRLRNVGDRRSGPLLITDQVDPALGAPPRLVLERLDPGDEVDTTYEVDARVRGRHTVGPLRLSLEDPFGIASTTRVTATTHTLTVTPVVVALDRTPMLTSVGGSGDGAGRRTAAAGHDDIGTRGYRAGDELRRIHWRATARTGELMVRQEEQPWEAQALVVLDTRVDAHSRRPHGTIADLSTSSFEWAVHAAASVGTHLARSERRVRLVAGRTDLTATGGAHGSLLDALAIVRTNREGLLLPDGARQASAPVVVAVLGTMDVTDVDAVTALRATSTSAVAIVLDTGTWTTRTRNGRTGEDGPVPREDLLSGEALRTTLVGAGWRVAVAHRGADLADVWDEALR